VFGLDEFNDVEGDPYVLLLEPDIIIYDIEAIQKDDQLILTTRSRFKKQISAFPQVPLPNPTLYTNSFPMQQSG